VRKEDIYCRTVAIGCAMLFCCTWLFHGHRLRVFENRVLSRIFGSKRDEVTGEWRRLQDKEIYDVYFSPNIIRVIKSRRMK
jgi:hypothetical protein